MKQSRSSHCPAATKMSTADSSDNKSEASDNEINDKFLPNTSKRARNCWSKQKGDEGMANRATTRDTARKRAEKAKEKNAKKALGVKETNTSKKKDKKI